MPDWRFSVPIGRLLELVLHFDSANYLHLEVYADKSLYVFDEDAGLSAHSLFAFLTEAQVLKRNEARMASAGRRTAVH